MREQQVEIKLSCEILRVSRSGYYARDKVQQRTRIESNRLLLQAIHRIHERSQASYGAPRMRAQLNSEGISCSKNRVARLMKQAGLSAHRKKSYRPKTTDSEHDMPVAERVYKTENSKTHPTRPNQVWASDITYISTEEGWLYLAIYLDVFSRKLVGYAMADHMRSELVLTALNNALRKQGPIGSDLTSHSDRGCQYASFDVQERLKTLGIRASMSRKGNCYDNAYAESFFATLKIELSHRYPFKTRQEAKGSIFRYIETWYNKQRLHSSLGFVSPIDYEKNYLLS